MTNPRGNPGSENKVLDIVIDAHPQGTISWTNALGYQERSIAKMNEGELLTLLEGLGPQTKARIMAHKRHQRYLGLFQMACASAGITFRVENV